MIWLWIPVIIWIIALLIMGLPKFVFKKIQKLKVELKIESKISQAYVIQMRVCIKVSRKAF